MCNKIDCLPNKREKNRVTVQEMNQDLEMFNIVLKLSIFQASDCLGNMHINVSLSCRKSLNKISVY